MIEEGAILELRKVSCTRVDAAVRDVSLSFFRGMINHVHGDAGSGLLLRLASLQERPDSGEIWLETGPTHELSDEELGNIRSRTFGFVFPAPCVLPNLSVAENVAMPLFKVGGVDSYVAARRTDVVLDFVGLADVLAADAGALAWGDQQKLSLARALAHEPRMLVLDRVESGLHPEDAAEFRSLIERACRTFDVSVIATVPLPPAGGYFPAHRTIAVEQGLVSEPGTPTQL